MLFGVVGGRGSISFQYISVLRDCGKRLNLGEQNLNNHNESNSELFETFFHLAQSLYVVQSSVAGWGIDTKALFECLICVISLHS